MSPASSSRYCGVSSPDDEVLRVVAPVAVGADPDLEQRRLALDDGPRRRRGERLDPRRPTRRARSRARARPCPPSRCLRRGRSPPTPRRSAPRVMPGSMISLQCSIAAAAMSFARRMRSISCSVLSARALARSGVASRPRRTPSNQSRVNVVGSPTMRSAACVPRESSSPTRPYSLAASRASSSTRAVGGRGSLGS